MPKFGMKVNHLRCDSYTSFKAKRSKVRVTDGRGILCRPNPAATLLVCTHMGTSIFIFSILICCMCLAIAKDSKAMDELQQLQ